MVRGGVNKVVVFWEWGGCARLQAKPGGEEVSGGGWGGGGRLLAKSGFV